MGQDSNHSSTGRWRFEHQFIHSRRVFPSIDLRDSADADESLGLEQIYEPIFEDSSHGFRPGRSPHTALQQIGQQWTAVKWMIEMDIQSYFDTINHELLMSVLEKKIEDKRFLRLIKAMLDAGYARGLEVSRLLQWRPSRLDWCATQHTTVILRKGAIQLTS